MAQLIQQQLLQIFMAKHVMSETEALQVYTDIVQRVEGSHRQPALRDLNLATNDLNSRVLKILNLRIKELSRYDFDDEPYLGIANTTENEGLNMILNSMKPEELTLFKNAVKAIVESGGGEISMDEFQKLRGKKVSLRESERLASRLLHEQWLKASTRRGYVCVGPRVYIELPELLQSFGAVECTTCQEELVRGVTCPHSACDVLLHRGCRDALFDVVRKEDEPSCPLCTNVWPRSN